MLGFVGVGWVVVVVEDTVTVLVTVCGDAVAVASTVMVEVDETGVAASLQAEVMMLAGYLVRTAGVEAACRAAMDWVEVRDGTSNGLAEPSCRLTLTTTVAVAWTVLVGVTVEVDVVVVSGVV